MITAEMFPSTYPWDLQLDAEIRSVAMVDPVRTYPLARENRELLYEMGAVMGHEGSDYQNPNVLQGRGVLAYDTPNSSKLVPAYGIGGAQSGDEVLLNILSTQHLLIGS